MGRSHEPDRPRTPRFSAVLPGYCLLRFKSFNYSMENWTNIMRLWMTFVYFCYIYFGWLLVHFATTMIDTIEILDLRMHQRISNNHRYFIFPSWFYMSSQSSRLITHLPSLPRQTLIGCGDDRCLEKGEGRQHHHLDPGRAWLHHGHHLYRKKHIYNHMHMYACTYAKMYAHHKILYTYILYTLYIFNAYCSQCIGIRIFK